MRRDMAEPVDVPANAEETVGEAPEHEAGLSSRILGLLSAVKLEERRKAKGKRSAPTGERRRRTDQSELE